MLSQKTINIIKSITPTFHKHKEDIISRFYEQMFSYNSQSISYTKIDNQENRQQRIFMEVIYSYMCNIDNLEKLNRTISTIAHQHASLMIQPEYYSAVGKNLLSFMKDILQEKMTPHITHAWNETYNSLIDTLVTQEKKIYDNNTYRKGGWRGFRDFIVHKKEKESSIITSFYLIPKDGGDLPYYMPGQYITVCISTSRTSVTMHNYSLSEKPGQDYFRISIKQEEKSHHYISDNNTFNTDYYMMKKIYYDINVDDILKIRPPCGNFFLHIDNYYKRPIVLLAAGIGITPILSILNTAVDIDSKQNITLIYGCLNEEVQAFKSTIDDLLQKHHKLRIHYCYNKPINTNIHHIRNCSIGLIDKKFMESCIRHRDADYYFCGPRTFMMNIYAYLMEWNVPQKQIHFESFDP